MQEENEQLQKTGYPAWAQIIVILTIAAAMTAIYFFKRETINTDAVRYVYCAQGIAAGNWYEALKHSKFLLTPFLIRCVYLIVPDWVIAGQIVCIAAMLLALIPFYLLSRELFESKRAFISTIFFAAVPYFRLTSVMIVRDPLFILAVAWFLLAIYRTFRASKYHILAFVSALAALMCRMEGVLLFGMYAFIVFWQGVRAGNRKIRKIAWITGVATLVLAAVLFCRFHEKMLHTDRMNVFAQAISSPAKFCQNFQAHRVFDALYRLKKDMEREGRGELVKTAYNHIFELCLLAIVQALVECAFFPAFILGVIGACASFSLKNAKTRFLLAWFLFFLLIPYIFLLKEDILSRRYLMSAAMVLCYWIGSGFYFLWDKAEQKFSLSPKWAFALLILLLAIPFGKAIGYRGSDSSVKKSGEWLKNITAEKVVTNDFGILFYAQIKFYPQKTDMNKHCNVPDLLKKAKKSKANYVAWLGKPTEFPQKPIVKFPGRKKNVYIFKIEHASEN